MSILQTKHYNQTGMLKAIHITLFLPLFFIFCRTDIKTPFMDFPVHLVIDAGSSGTRICTYEIKYKKNNSYNTSCRTKISLRSNSCVELKASDGIASLNEDDIKKVMQDGVNIIPWKIRKKINHAVLLGTGGFRKINSDEQRRKLNAAYTVLSQAGISSSAEVITGEDEGKLSWFSIGDLFSSSSHAVIETGGATIQMTYGKSPEMIRSISFKAGMNESFLKLSQLKEMESCYQETDSGSKSFSKCRDLIYKNIFMQLKQDPFFQKLSDEDKQLDLYGTGAPWNSVFQTTRKSILTKDELAAEGNAICSKNFSELENMGIKNKYVKKTCYLFAFQSAFLEITGADRIRNGRESWSRGASVSKKYFPDCM